MYPATALAATVNGDAMYICPGGKDATLCILSKREFFGERGLAGQP